MSKLIPLYRRNNFSGFVTFIDDSDFDTVNSFKWYLSGDKTRTKRLYAVRFEPITREHWKTILMHHHIMGRPPAGFEWDHRDRDSLNNQRENLRICTRAQNNANKPPYNKSGYKGVLKHCRRWQAQITIDRQRILIGSFETPEEAAKAYDLRASEAFGEFAYLNFPL